MLKEILLLLHLIYQALLIEKQDIVLDIEIKLKYYKGRQGQYIIQIKRINNKEKIKFSIHLWGWVMGRDIKYKNNKVLVQEFINPNLLSSMRHQVNGHFRRVKERINLFLKIL
jgi:hypothetical protein